MAQTIELGLKAALKGGSTEAFKTLASAFRGLGKELKATAKDLYNMGKTETADSLGHVGMAVDRLTTSFSNLHKTGKDTSKLVDENTKSMTKYSKEIGAVKDAWMLFSKGGTASGAALKSAVSWTERFSASIQNMKQQMRIGGASESSIQKWAESLDFSKIKGGLKSGDLKLVGSNMEFVRKEGYALMGMNTNLIKSIDAFNKSQSIYARETSKAKGISDSYGEAVSSLGKKFQYNNEQAKIWAPALQSVHTAMEKTKVAAVGTGVAFTQMTRDTKLAALTQAVLQKDLKASASGFTVMNEKGLKAFSGLTEEAASKLGMLSKGFNQLGVKVGSQSLLDYGKALDSSKGKSDKFLKGLAQMANKHGVLTQAFRDQYEDMKRSESIWNKHVTTLQKTGKITEDTAKKMKDGFNASAVSSNALTAALRKPQKEYEELRKAINRVSSITGQSTAALHAEAQALKAQKKPHDDIGNAINNKISTYKQYSNLASQIETAEKRLAETTGANVKKIHERTAAQINSAKSDQDLITVAKKRLEELQRENTTIKENLASKDKMDKTNVRLRSTYHDLATTNRDFVKELNNVVKAYGRSDIEGKKAEARLKLHAKATRDAAKAMTIFQRITADVIDHIKSFASYAAAATFIAGMVGGFGLATAAIIDFDQSLKDLQSITGATDREVALMGKTIKAVASSTKFSAQEVAEGMKILGQAGLTAQESIEAIQAVSDLSTGTLSDMATSVDLVTTAMAVFNIKATDSSHIADVFANAINKSKLDVEKLRVAFNYVGTVAEETGVTFEDTAAAMSELSNKGIRASTIGTGLRQVLEGLVKPSEDFQAGIKAAGMSIDDFNPQMHSMGKIIGNLSVVVNTSEKAFRMFGIRGASAVTALISNGEAGFNKMKSAVSQSGTAAVMAAKQMEGLAARLKNMYDKAKLVAVALGELGLSKILGFLIDSMRGFLDIIVYITGNPLGALIIQLGIATVALSAMYAAFMVIKAASFGTMIAAFAGHFTALVPRIYAAATAMGVFNITLGPLGWSIVAISTALTAVGIGFSMYRKHLQESYDESKNLSNEFKSLADSVADYEVKIASLDKTTQEYKDAAFELRTKLIEVGKGNTALAASARLVVSAIHPLTGQFEEGSTALDNFYKKARELETINLAKAFEASGRIFEESMSNLNVFINTAKGKLLEFSAFALDLFSKIPNIFLPFFNLPGADEFERKIKDAGGELLDLSEIVKKFKNGDATFKDMETALNDVGFASTAMGKTMKVAFDQMQKEAAEVINKLMLAGDADYSMSTDSIIKVAKDMGYLTNATDTQIQAVIQLVNETKELKNAEINGLAEKWSAEFDKAGSFYEDFVSGISGANTIAILGVLDLNKETIKGFEEQKKGIAAAAKANAKMYKDGTIDVTQYIRTKSSLEKQAMELSMKMIESEDMKRYEAIKKADANYEQEYSKLAVRYEKNLILEEEFLKQKEELGQAYADKIIQINSNIYDPKELAAQFKEFKETAEEALAELILNAEKQEALGLVSKEQSERKKLQLSLDTYRQIEQEAKRHYAALSSQNDRDPVAMASALKRYKDASTKYLQEETKALQEVNQKRGELEEKIKDWGNERIDKTKEINAKIAEIEDDLGDKILEINKSLQEKIEDLLEKRADIYQKASADIAGNQSSLQDKIRKIHQKGMSDEAKDYDNSLWAQQKYIKGIELLNKAKITSDEKMLDQAKKLLDDSASLYESLENPSKAVAGVSQVSKAMDELINVDRDIAVKAIDKEIADERMKAKEKVAIAKEESGERIAAENRRHANEMKNLDTEIARAKEKIAILNGQQDTVMNHNTNTGDVTNADKTSTNAGVSQTEISSVEKINGVWQQVTKNVQQYNQEVKNSGTAAAKETENIAKIDGVWQQVSKSVSASKDSMTEDTGFDKTVRDSDSAARSLEALSHVMERVNTSVINTTMDTTTASGIVKDLAASVNSLFSENVTPTEKLDAAMKAYNTVAASGQVATGKLQEMFVKLQAIAVEADKPITLELDGGREFVTTIDEAGKRVTKLYDSLKASPLQFDKNATVLKFLEQIPGMIQVAEDKIKNGRPIEIPIVTQDIEGSATELVNKIRSLNSQIQSGEIQGFEVPIAITEVENAIAEFKEKVKESGDIFPVNTDEMFKKVEEEWNTTIATIKEDPAEVVSKLDKSSYNKVVDALNKLSEDIYVTIHTKNVSGKSQGGRVRGYASGGRFPGVSSTRDTELVKARKGEWFIRNESADYWDSLAPGFMNGINKPFSSVGRMIADTIKNQNITTRNKLSTNSRNLTTASGGDIMSKLQSFGTVSVTLGGESATIIADPLNAKSFLKMIRKMEMGASS